MLGRSPERNRAMNESASSSIGSRSSDEGDADASADMVHSSLRFGSIQISPRPPGMFARMSLSRMSARA